MMPSPSLSIWILPSGLVILASLTGVSKRVLCAIMRATLRIPPRPAGEAA
ncbi:hypothetical protein GCM10027416_24020 [Okibacterium endophyticum]